MTRLDYDESWIESCDAVFPVGGDGTFLLGASRVRGSTKPVVGFNSDPEHSEGFLCLPHKYSHNVDQVLNLLQEVRLLEQCSFTAFAHLVCFRDDIILTKL